MNLCGYTAGELRTLYMDAADRRKAVLILMDITLSKMSDVLEWLESMGLPSPDNQTTRKQDAFDHKMELYDAGLSDPEIAGIIGTSAKAVFEWRKRNGLPANCHRGRPKGSSGKPKEGGKKK